MEEQNRKIAIMGWHQMYNFGSQLQLTALLHVIRKMGFEPEIVDYESKQEKYYDKKDMRFVAERFINKFLYIRNPEFLSEEKKKMFQNYKEKHFTFSSKCSLSNELYNLNGMYAAFICGSDQIWNPYIGDDKYFLDFVEDNQKKIAYAPSFGVDHFPNRYVEEKIYNLLKDFGSISIRELHGRKLLKDIGIENVPVVLDPTLLLDRDQWNDLLSLKCEPKEEYILCYFLGNAKKHLRYINRLHKKLKKKVVVIAARKKDLSLPFEVHCEVGPREFVELIQGACFVCTDSFHGVCFSVIYRKRFCVFERFNRYNYRNQNSRIDSILKILNLEWCKVIQGRMGDDIFDSAWDEVGEKINVMSRKSYLFLQDAVQYANASANLLPEKITNTCCGCGACKTVCDFHAIKIYHDKNGNLKTKVNRDICTGCGKCINVCPFRGEGNLQKLFKAHYYSFQSKSNKVLLQSSSGGASFEILNYLSKQGYIIYGCIYDNKKEIAVHRLINHDEIYKTQGLKYLRSDVYEVMKEVAQTTDKVVFVGTPCQVSAMDKILTQNKKRNTTILIDFICHGVPTDYLWSRYLDEIKRKLHASETSIVKFREKRYGWHKRVIMVLGSNGAVYRKRASRDSFYQFYNQSNCLSDQCYECCFKEKTAADIRLGDYWGKKYKRDRQGVSRVFTLSEKGDKLMQELRVMADISAFPIEHFFMEEDLVNPVKPIYYNNLIKDLHLNQESMKKLKRIYCDEWYIEYLYKIKGVIKAKKALFMDRIKE